MPQAQEKDSLRMRLLLSCLSQRDGEDVSDGGALPLDDVADQFFGISSLGSGGHPTKEEREGRRHLSPRLPPSPPASLYQALGLASFLHA